MSGSWIAKPVRSLTPREVKLWSDMGMTYLPLSQTLSWGRAIEAVDGKCVAVFSPERKVSAVFMILGNVAECVNGPILDWAQASTPASLNEQVSRVVHALHQSHPFLTEIRLRPRLMESELSVLSTHLAFPMDSMDQAQTLQIDLNQDASQMWVKIPPRIRHEIRRAKREGVVSSVRDGREGLDDFWERTMCFYQTKGLYIPNASFIRALLGSPDAGLASEIIRSEHPSTNAVSEILILHQGGISTYFYAYEIRGEATPNISLNACAQWEAILRGIAHGSRIYDLNGILHSESIEEVDPEYLGVDRYKRKFKGRVVSYFNPLIRFGSSE